MPAEPTKLSEKYSIKATKDYELTDAGFFANESILETSIDEELKKGTLLALAEIDTAVALVLDYAALDELSKLRIVLVLARRE